MPAARFTGEFKSLMRLAVPVALSQLATIGMQVVDTIFVGRLGAEALGGIGLGNAILSTFLVFSFGLLTGMDFPTSYAIGKGDRKEAHEYLFQGLYLATAVSIPFTFVMLYVATLLPHFGVDPGVAREAERYLSTISWSFWPACLFLAIRHYLQALGIANPILAILIVANLVNAAANWLLVFGNWGFPRLEIVGSGLATVIARIFMLILALTYLVWLNFSQKLGIFEASWRLSREKLHSIIRYGLPASFQVALEVGVFSGATLLAGYLGAIPLAAHQIVLQIASFTFMLPLGFSSASAVRVAQALGRGEPKTAGSVGTLAITISGLLMAGIGISLYLLSDSLLQVFTTDPEVIAVASTLLLIAAVFQISDGLQVCATGTLRGAGETRVPMLANLVGHWMIGLPIGTALCFWLDKGITGLWIGLSIGLTAVAASLVLYWRSRAARFHLQLS